MTRKIILRDIPDSLFWDAGYLIACFATEDQYHNGALKIRKYLACKKIKLVTSWPSVSEASTLLLYHYGYSHALALFGSMEAFEIITPLEDEYQKATALFAKLDKDHKLSFNDVLTYQIIKERLKSIPLLTFDKDFSKVGLTVFIP